MNHNNFNIEFHKSFNQSKELINTCQNISSTCNTFDTLNNSFFVDDEYQSLSDFPWLYYATIDSNIIGFISIYIIDTYNIEICGFVLPQFRRNKVATNLFSMMVMDFDSKSFQLSMDMENEIGKAFVCQMGFAYCATECHMKLDKKNYNEFHDWLSLTPEKHDTEIIQSTLYADWCCIRIRTVTVLYYPDGKQRK